MNNQKVVLFMFANINFASRLRKEALSLEKAGYNVTIIGLTEKAIKLNMYKDNIKIIGFSLNYKLKLINILFYNLYLFKFFIKNKFDIYHLHNLDGTFIAIMFSLNKKRRLIFDAHELNYHKRHNPEKLRNKLITLIDVFKEKLLIKFSDVIIQANDKRAELFAQFYNCKKPISIENHEPIIDIDENKSIRNYYNIPKEQKILIFTGYIRVGFNQSVDKVVEALKYIHNDYHLYLLGNIIGNAKDILINISKENKVEDRLHFIPPIPYDDVVHFISGSDIAVIPIFATSLNSRYSALNKVSQSLMAGLPLVTSNYENLDDLIYNGKNYIGETFDVTQPNSIANATNKLINNDLNKAKQFAREIALTRINWKIEAVKLLDIYKKLE